MSEQEQVREPQRLGETKTFEDLKDFFDQRAAEFELMDPMERERRDAILRSEKEAQAAAEKLHEIKTRIDGQIPTRYRLAELSNPLIEDWCERLVRGQQIPDLLIVGPTGVGKTYTCWAVAARLIGSGHQGLILVKSTVSLLSGLRPAGDLDGKRASALNQSAREASLLIVDDVGVHKSSEWSDERLFEILDERYSWCLPTILTSNLLPTEIGKSVGDRVASRLNESCVVIPLEGPDRRRQHSS